MDEINRLLRRSPSSRPFLLLKVQHGDEQFCVEFQFLAEMVGLVDTYYFPYVGVDTKVFSLTRLHTVSKPVTPMK